MKLPDWTRLLLLCAIWLALSRVVPEVLWHLLPSSFLATLSLPAYGMLAQLVTTAMGLGLSRGLLARPARSLAVRAPSGWAVAVTMLVTPALFVVASFVALKIAEPSLLRELATEGAGASRRNAGALGRAVTQAPLAITLLWGVVLAAFAEELMFRGALFAAVGQTARALFRRRAADRGEGADEAPLPKWPGTIALVVAGVTFGAMHADMKGSVGIVRVVSTTCLGLACGGVRLASGSVLAAMLLHFAYNSVSLGTSRGIFRGDSEPLVSVVPNPLLAAAVVGLVAGGGLIVARRAAGRSE